MKNQQLISISKDEDINLMNNLEEIAKKENRPLSDVILSFLKTGYQKHLDRTINYSTKRSVVSLFSGAGGLDLGLEMAGLEVIWANEFDSSACDTYAANNPGVYIERGDVRNVKKFPKADVMVGGYPCQGFSLAGHRLITDNRNYLYKEFIRALRQVEPKFFIAENVKGLLTIGGGKIIEAMVEEFKLEGYKVEYKLVNAKNYGVPQDRERVFIVGVRNDIEYEYEFPNPTHGEKSHLLPYNTIKDAISHLKKAEIGEIFEGGFSSRYLSRNRKREWDDVSFTIQASGRHAPLHPSGERMVKKGKDEWILPKTTEHRRLSVIEIALIQTFPANYIWKGTINSKYKQIGNAVPCLLAREISRPIAEFLKEYYKSRERV